MAKGPHTPARSEVFAWEMLISLRSILLGSVTVTTVPSPVLGDEDPMGRLTWVLGACNPGRAWRTPSALQEQEGPQLSTEYRTRVCTGAPCRKKMREALLKNYQEFQGSNSRASDQMRGPSEHRALCLCAGCTPAEQALLGAGEGFLEV